MRLTMARCMSVVSGRRRSAGSCRPSDAMWVRVCNPASIARIAGSMLRSRSEAREDNMPDSRVKIASVSDVPEGEGRAFEVGSRSVAVFNVDGRFYAIDNECPHRGGPLGEGDLIGTVVSCPWHAWRWDVTTGANVNNPAVKIACIPVVVADGDILLEV